MRLKRGICLLAKKSRAHFCALLRGKPDTRVRTATVAPFRAWRDSRRTRRPASPGKKWRRGEDSNLRYPFGYTHFPGVLLKPSSDTSPRGRPINTKLLGWQAKSDQKVRIVGNRFQGSSRLPRKEVRSLQRALSMALCRSSTMRKAWSGRRKLAVPT